MTVDLVERSVAGDQQAFEALIGMYWRRAEAVAAAVVNGDQAAVDDVVQEAFVKAYEKLATLHETHRFAPWLMRIVRNEAVTWLRKHAKVKSQHIDESVAGQTDDQDMETDPWVGLLPQALENMRKADREIIYLKYQAQLDYQQLSESLGISLPAVEKRLYRARRRLEKILAELSQQ